MFEQPQANLDRFDAVMTVENLGADVEAVRARDTPAPGRLALPNLHLRSDADSGAPHCSAYGSVSGTRVSPCAHPPPPPPPPPTRRAS